MHNNIIIEWQQQDDSNIYVFVILAFYLSLFYLVSTFFPSELRQMEFWSRSLVKIVFGSVVSSSPYVLPPISPLFASSSAYIAYNTSSPAYNTNNTSAADRSRCIQYIPHPTLDENQSIRDKKRSRGNIVI